MLEAGIHHLSRIWSLDMYYEERTFLLYIYAIIPSPSKPLQKKLKFSLLEGTGQLSCVGLGHYHSIALNNVDTILHNNSIFKLNLNFIHIHFNDYV